jgi:Arc/MetJ-type ribon-helix-helix transcriptional regulator
MNLTLPTEIERLLSNKVENGEFESVEAAVMHTLRQSLEGEGPSGGEEETVASPRNIWDAIERLRENAAPEVKEALNRLPKDLAEEHDHYVYGTPKKYS